MAEETKVKYCIAMLNTPRQNPEHTLPLLLKGKDDPVLFLNLEDAVTAAEGFRKWQPEIEFKVYEFYMPCRFVYEIFQYGTWMLSKEPVA